MGLQALRVLLNNCEGVLQGSRVALNAILRLYRLSGFCCLLHNRLLVVIWGSAPVPHKGLCTGSQGAVQWSQGGSMGS